MEDFAKRLKELRAKEGISQESIKNRELLNMFNSVQKFNDKQKDTIKDLISAFILKSNLQQQLAS